MSNKMKNILERALKTFIEGALGYFAVSISSGNFELTKTVLVGALAMGLSALINYIQSLLVKEGD